MRSMREGADGAGGRSAAALPSDAFDATSPWRGRIGIAAPAISPTQCRHDCLIPTGDLERRHT